MQSRQNKAEFRRMGRLDTGFRATQKEAFESLVFEASDHENSVTRYVTRVNVERSLTSKL